MLHTITAWLRAVWHWIAMHFQHGGGKSAPKKPQEAMAAPIEDQLIFRHSDRLTLGVEFELGLVEADTAAMSPAAQEMLDALKSTHAHQEAAGHVLELTTGICRDVQATESELSSLIAEATQIADGKGLALTGTGRVTLFENQDVILNRSKRYDYLDYRRQILYRHFNCMQGMHIHIGMKDAEDCVRYHNFFVHLLPHILALSASTPTDNLEDTGLASMRAAISEALPVAGLPYHFNNWQEYCSLCTAMAQADSIRSLKDLWGDLRPCPRFGTLEIRIADQPATLAEAMAVVAFVHGLAKWFEENSDWLDEMHRPSGWRMRDNKWRAMRYGLDAKLITNNQGEVRPITEEIQSWIKRIEPYTDAYNYQNYMATLRHMLNRGNSSQRQRRVLHANDGDMATLAKFNMREWRNAAPLWDEVEAAGPDAIPSSYDAYDDEREAA
jgi:carboxylate-amine ligase